ncbi:TetR/AcrR family transcriptional regulator [Streptomyces sp. WMMB303]|uniref:TetR/AcrR family transcriptional regulator n=1 Tax=Streptomyces sp. WMMB303 TaxID=3034154 RepID=UPI0023ECB44E|nr:TetR/AcrR family transcriptional regulator [Streptomyces sp. WMMB303]MDF4252777.1 TetR/AcrR family transcriptional regulator [Streptomyces sp. WMMB303]
MDEPNTDAGLRGRLVSAGVELVAAEGARGVSLREIARHAGVSHGAPRRYFPTYLALLSAIAREGFGQLAAEAGEVLAGRPQEGPRAQLAALARSYLAFARDHRGMYELMFRHDLLESGELGLREVSLPLFEVLVDLVARAGREGGAGPGGDPRARAGALWANLHGIAQLSAWRSLPLATAAGQDEVLEATLDAHLAPVGG